MTIQKHWTEFWEKFWDTVLLWIDKREKKAMFRKGICPVCRGEYRRSKCKICGDIKIIPWTPEDRVTIRDQYKIISGIDLFN